MFGDIGQSAGFGCDIGPSSISANYNSAGVNQANVDSDTSELLRSMHSNDGVRRAWK